MQPSKPARAVSRLRRGLVAGRAAPVRRALGRAVRLILPDALRAGLRKVRREVDHLIGAFGHLRSVDVLIFSGGGQLDDEWGGAGEHPWAMFKWALLARLRNGRVLFLSVGYGKLRRAGAGCWFVWP